MPRGGQGDNLLFKEGGVTKRSMPPSFHANLFALAAARYRCHDIGGFVIGAMGTGYFAATWCRLTWLHCAKSTGAGLTVAHGVAV